MSPPSPNGAPAGALLEGKGEGANPALWENVYCPDFLELVAVDPGDLTAAEFGAEGAFARLASVRSVEGRQLSAYSFGREVRPMEATRRLEIELPEELAESVRARVDSGQFATASEVVCAGLQLLEGQQVPHEPSVDAQLAAGYDAWKANPTAVYTLDEVDEHLRRQRVQHRK